MNKLGMSDKEWNSLKDTFIGMIPNYDRINSKISFGLDDKWRRMIAAESIGKDSVLEIGSGPGTLAVKLKSNKIYCLDPIPEMHEAAVKKIKKIKKQDLERYKFILGFAESIPLKDDFFDVVFCAFSFRDFFDKRKSLKEIYRVLKPGGKLVILDIAKHNSLYSNLIYFYIKNIASRLSRGRKEMKALSETYKAFAPPKYYANIMREIGFSEIKIKFLNFKTIFVLDAVK